MHLSPQWRRARFFERIERFFGPHVSCKKIKLQKRNRTDPRSLSDCTAPLSADELSAWLAAVITWQDTAAEGGVIADSRFTYLPMCSCIQHLDESTYSCLYAVCSAYRVPFPIPSLHLGKGRWRGVGERAIMMQTCVRLRA